VLQQWYGFDSSSPFGPLSETGRGKGGVGEGQLRGEGAIKGQAKEHRPGGERNE